MGLNAAQLAAMRSVSDAALPDTCTIQRTTPTADGMGGETDAWANLAVGVPVRISPEQSIEAAETERGGSIAGVKRWVLTLPYNQDVTLADRVVLGGRTLEVVSIDGPRSWEIARRIRCIEVT